MQKTLNLPCPVNYRYLIEENTSTTIIIDFIFPSFTFQYWSPNYNQLNSSLIISYQPCSNVSGSDVALVELHILGIIQLFFQFTLLWECGIHLIEDGNVGRGVQEKQESFFVSYQVYLNSEAHNRSSDNIIKK